MVSPKTVVSRRGRVVVPSVGLLYRSGGRPDLVGDALATGCSTCFSAWERKKARSPASKLVPRQWALWSSCCVDVETKPSPLPLDLRDPDGPGRKAGDFILGRGMPGEGAFYGTHRKSVFCETM